MIPTPDTAEKFYKEGNYRASLQIYLDIAQQESRNARIYQGLAQSYYQLKNFESAKSAAEKAIELDSTLCLPYTVLAYIDFYQNKNMEKALAEALEAYNLSPKMEETINCYGSLLAASGRLNEGKSVLMQGLEIYPKSVPLHYNLGVAYIRERDNKKSLEEFKKVFTLKPTIRHAIQLLLVYQRRYAFLYSLIVIATLFGSLLLKARVLLIIPLVAAIEGWIMIYYFLNDRRWRDGFIFVVGNGLLTLLIYWFYVALG